MLIVWFTVDELRGLHLGNRVSVCRRDRYFIFPFPQPPKLLWNLPSLYTVGAQFLLSQRKSGRNVKLTIRIHVVMSDRECVKIQSYSYDKSQRDALFLKFILVKESQRFIQYILVINQLDAQNLFYNKFISCLYMFRAPCAHRQEVKIILYILWHHHTYRWPSGARDGHL